MSEEATLFPAPLVPVEAVPHLQTAATAVRVSSHQLERTLLYGGEWPAATVQEIVRLVTALISVRTDLENMLAATRAGI